MKLLVLRCLKCDNPLTPENEHISTVCDQCQTVIHISENGLSRLKIYYGTPTNIAEANITRWLPFWIFKGKVHILNRDIQGWGSKKKAMKKLWGEQRYLYVPAWELPFKESQAVSIEMTEQQPVYNPTPQPAELTLEPVTITAKDARKMLDFLVMSIEANRSDWLKKLDFRLEVDEPKLWALPANNNSIVAVIK